MSEDNVFPRRQFATTHWSVVRAAADARSPQSQSALESLLLAYWYPLYAFARRRGFSSDEASEMTQGFFARLIEKQDWSGADPQKGRFRNFLLGAFEHYLANERDKARAQKRGGGQFPLSLDFVSGERRFSNEPGQDAQAERAFEREWAAALLEESFATLQQDWDQKGKSNLLHLLTPFLVTGGESAAYLQAAKEAGMSEGAFKVAAHRLRQEFRTVLRAKLAQTVSGEEELEEEIRALFAAFEK